MSDFFHNGWSVFVAVATVVSLVACLWLLAVASRREVMADDNSTGHVFDVDLVEMNNPRDLVPESNMPAYPWLDTARLAPADMSPKLVALRRVGVPYTDADIAAAGEAVKDKTELDALVAYLQVLGTALK